jgi:hypothetical protein
VSEENRDIADAEAESDGDKPGSVLAQRAKRSLRRAKKQYEQSDWEDSAEANYFLREANVLALLDVAQAFRESFRGSND